MMPMRHVAYHNTLVSRSGVFAQTALPALRRAWGAYWQCKVDAACRPSLCAPGRVDDARWLQSGLARACVARADGAQWHVPSEPPSTAVARSGSSSASADNGGSAASKDGRSLDVAGWHAVRRSCEAKGGDAARGANDRRRSAALVVCARSRWKANLTSSLSLKHRKAAAAARVAAANATVAATLHGAGSPTVAAAAQPMTLAPTRVVERDGRSFLSWAE
jgi:hypothetical protein